MGEPTFSYTVDNDRIFRNQIQRALLEVNNLTVPFNQIAFDWYKSNKSIFGLKGPGQYPDLSKGYRKFKIIKYGFDYPILKATGRLESSVLSKDSPESIYINTGQSITLGTQVPYGIYHQSDRSRSKIPLRKFIFIGPEAPRFATSEQMGRPERWLNIINNYVLKKMGAKVK